MPSLFNPEELVNFGKNLTKDTLNTLPLWAREKPPVAPPSVSAPVNASKEVLAGIEDIDRTGDLAAGLLKGSRGALNTLGSLPYLNVEKGQDLLDSIGTAEKSFYQGKIPNEALAKFASPTVGAATGAAAGAAISHFTPHPLAKMGLPTIGGAIGGALGLLGSGNLTPDQKKAAQIRSEEAGAQKPFVNALQKGDWRQLQADAISALGAYPKLASDVAATIVGIPNAISENIGKGLKETNIPLLKQYGEITEEGAKKAQKSSEESHKFLEDLINKTTNLPYQVKDEKEGRAVAMQLPLEALRSLSSEEMKALVRGENPNNISIPAALSKAYSESQNLNAQKRMVQEFKKQGKSDEEIEKLVSFGMAGRPLESLAQGFATDPTMYIDPLIGLSKLGKVGKGAQRIKAEQKLLTQGEKGGELATIGKQELATKPIEGELIESVAAPRPTGDIIEGTALETPKQLGGKAPLQLEAPKSLDSELLSERQRLETEGIDPTDPEGETQLINSLVSKGYDEDEIIQTILKQEEAGIEPPVTTPESSNISKQEIPQPQTPEQPLSDSYVNPSEQDIYSLLKEGTLPLEEDLTYKLTHGGGLPLGFYETTPKGEKLVPVYQDVEKGITKRVPVKFQFSSPLEKEIFNLGGEYVDWMRDAAIGDIKAEQGIERTSTAHKVLTDKQRQERFKDMGRRLLTGTSDPTYIDNLGLPNEGKKELEALEEQFVKKIYSGGKASKGGAEGEGVVGHVPNSIRKELLKQIETKFGFTGKTAAEKKAILQKIKPEDLADVVFSPQSTAYKGIIDKTKEFRSKFSDLLTKYGIKPPSSLKEEIPMSQSKEAILQQGKGTTEGMTQGEGTLLRNLNKGKSQIEQGTPLLESIANQKEKGIKGLLESPQTLKESEGIKEIPMSEIPKSNLGMGTPIEPELVKNQGNIQSVNTPSNDIIKEESINAVEKVKELKKKNGEMLTKYGEKWKTDPAYKKVQSKIKDLETTTKKEPSVVQEPKTPTQEKPKSSNVVGSKLEFNGKEYNISGIQEESGLPIIDMPNKDGSITKLPLTKNSISKTNWNSLKKNLTKGSQDILYSATSEEFPGSPLDLLLGREPILKFNQKYGSQIPITDPGRTGAYYSSGSKTVSVSPRRANAMTHEEAHEFNASAFKNDKNLYSQSMKKLKPLFEKYPEFKQHFNSIPKITGGDKEASLRELHSDWYNHKLNAGANFYPHTSYILEKGSPEDLKIIKEVVNDIDKSYIKTKKDPTIPESAIEEYYKLVDEGIKSGKIYDPKKVQKDIENHLVEIPLKQLQIGLHRLYQKNLLSGKKPVPARIYNDTQKFLDQIAKSDRTVVNKSKYFSNLLEEVNKYKNKTDKIDTLDFSNLLQDIRSRELD